MSVGAGLLARPERINRIPKGLGEGAAERESPRLKPELWRLRVNGPDMSLRIDRRRSSQSGAAAASTEPTYVSLADGDSASAAVPDAAKGQAAIALLFDSESFGSESG